MRQLLFWRLLDKNRTECSVWYIFPLGCIIEKIILNKGEYIMETERNNGNDSVIFEISSKGENMQNINRYTEKKEQQLSYQQKLLQEILQKNKEKG